MSVAKPGKKKRSRRSLKKYEGARRSPKELQDQPPPFPPLPPSIPQRNQEQPCLPASFYVYYVCIILSRTSKQNCLSFSFSLSASPLCPTLYSTPLSSALLPTPAYHLTQRLLTPELLHGSKLHISDFFFSNYQKDTRILLLEMIKRID